MASFTHSQRLALSDYTVKRLLPDEQKIIRSASNQDLLLLLSFSGASLA